MAGWKNNTDFYSSDLDSLFTSVSQFCRVYLPLPSSCKKFPSCSHSPVLSQSQVSQKLFIQPRRGSHILIATLCHRRLTFQIAILFYPLPILSLIIFSSLSLPHSQWTSPPHPRSFICLCSSVFTFSFSSYLVQMPSLLPHLFSLRPLLLFSLPSNFISPSQTVIFALPPLSHRVFVHVCACFSCQFSPCLNTHLQAIIKWLES